MFCRARRLAHPRVRVLLLVAGLSLSTAAQAWGPQGHALVAEIAATHLDSGARAAVSRLLAREHHRRLDQIGSWADAIRHDRPRTGPWHFVNIPLSAPGYRAARDCPHSDCLVAQLTQWAHRLGDPGTNPRRRLEALKFVVHFVADAHQPLHVADHHDYGGNDVHLRYFGRRTNLHAVWDGAIIEHALHLYVGPHYSIDRQATRAAAARLDAAITPGQRRAWTRGVASAPVRRVVIRWVDQAHRLARRVAYGDLPNKPRPAHWSARYQKRAWPVVRRQLQRAGIRLAALLNRLLGPH